MSTEKFIKHFKLPKSEINKIKKEYSDAKTKVEQIDPDKLKDFHALSALVFDVFEEIADRKVNREIMVAHTSYYFDEGFEIIDMIQYLRHQKAELYYREHPENFTIARLFPIKDQEFINHTWDKLAYFQGCREKNKDPVDSMVGILLKCGHSIFLKDYRRTPGCRLCLETEFADLEISQHPYDLMPLCKTNEQRELCWFFMRLNEESLSDYAQRTFEKRREILRAAGYKCGSENFAVEILKIGGAIK